MKKKEQRIRKKFNLELDGYVIIKDEEVIFEIPNIVGCEELKIEI